LAADAPSGIAKFGTFIFGQVRECKARNIFETTALNRSTKSLHSNLHKKSNFLKATQMPLGPFIGKLLWFSSLIEVRALNSGCCVALLPARGIKPHCGRRKNGR
jgi:hypothetical protein